MDLKKLVFDNIKDIAVLSEVDNLYNLLTYTADSKNGDITLPCFSLAKVLRKSPLMIADEVKNNISSDVFEKVENVNGYLNFYFDKKKVYSLVVQDDAGNIRELGKGKTVFLDFSSLNLAKYMHIGHLSTTVIGSVISNTYEYLGYNVKRLNYVGDYGTPFGKMITAIKHWGNEEEIENHIYEVYPYSHAHWRFRVAHGAEHCAEDYACRAGQHGSVENEEICGGKILNGGVYLHPSGHHFAQ